MISAILLSSASALLVTTYGTVQISSDPFTNPESQHSTEVEPHILVSGSTIVATFQQGRYFGGGCSDIGFATSIDNGLTWRDGSLPGLTIFSGGDTYRSVSDPAVAHSDAQGVWLIVSLAVGGDPKIFVSRSADGMQWDNPITVAAGDPASFFDKPWIVCDNTPTSPFFGNCYIEWDDVSKAGGVLMSTSSNGGATWGPALSTADQTFGLGGEPLVQPSGRVVVPYFRFDGTISSFISDDGGQHWSASVAIADVARHPTGGGLRAPALPSAAIDGDGTIYVAWSDCRFRDSCSTNDIVVSTSSDGVNWSNVVRVPIDGLDSTVDHFIPGLGADRNSFAPNVNLALLYFYYPRADCQNDCRLTAGFITSRDGLSGWANRRDLTGPMELSWLADTNQGRMVGDYAATYYTDDGVPHPVFAAAIPPSEQFFESMFTTAPTLAAEAGKIACRGSDCTTPYLDVRPRFRATLQEPQGAGLRIVSPTYYINIGTRIQLQGLNSLPDNAPVQWSLEEGPAGGTITTSGMYTAPLTPGIYHVIASNGVERAVAAIEVFTVR